MRFVPDNVVMTKIYKEFLEFVGTKVLNEPNPVTKQQMMRVMERQAS